MITSSPMQTVIGILFKRKLGKGAKKDETVNAIFTEDGRDLVIRHDNGTAFQDIVFDGLQGKRVQLTGAMMSFVLVVDQEEELPPIEKAG
jgi:hypothetical protein